MKICGVVAEYNPFHNGHRHQLDEARRLSGCQYVVCAMGGAFSQRGESMLLDKWTRARMALLGGADAVIELPALHAVRSADAFASGGVNLLAGVGATSISFGCETRDIALLHRALELLDTEDDELKTAIRLGLSQGQSLARARGEAVSRRLGVEPDLLARPNTILALEYLRANRRLPRPMEPILVPRTGDYHAPELSPDAGASAIRRAVSRGETDGLDGVMPREALSLLADATPGRLADMSRLDSLVIDRLRRASPEELTLIPEISEGLEQRLIRCVQSSGSREALLAALKCKRYTHARLSRLIAQALLGITRPLVERHPLPEYARLLGFRRDARPLLTAMGQGDIPLIARPVLLKENEVFALERRATDLQSLCFPDEGARAAGRDYTEPIIMI